MSDYRLYGERAGALHKEGFGCAQAVFASLCEEFGVDRVTALRTAAGFGSGIGRCAETCGAVTGAVMLIGLKYGKFLPLDTTHDNVVCYELVQTYVKKFIDEFGTCKCRDLLGADPSTEEGRKYIEDNNLSDLKCDVFIRKGAEIIAEMLLDT